MKCRHWPFAPFGSIYKYDQKKSQNALSVEYTQLPASPDQKRPIQGALLPDLGRKLGLTAMASGVRTGTVSSFP